jgi:CheY-like chemotaxis protein
VSKIVLCVDDSATMQQVADITFRGTEFTYVGARTYDEGLDKAKSQKPTLILADSQMPGQGKSGYDLCLALKSEASTSNIPVAILIGNAAPYDAARGAQVGADANLPKPWDTQTMLEKVTELIAKAAAGVAKPGHATGAPAAPAVPAAASKPAPVPAAGSVAAAASAAMPPRSATIMGMPTIKMPAGNAQPATPATPLAAPAPAPAPAPPPAAPVKAAVSAPASAPAAASPGTSPAIRAQAPAPPPPAPVAVSVAPPAAMPVTANVVSRAPMVSGTPTKRSVLVERTLAKMAARLAEAAGLDPGSPELLALLKLSTEVIERIVWEVVPDLAEQIIRENLHDLTARRS